MILARTLFVDTSYIVALFNWRDEHHAPAIAWHRHVTSAGTNLLTTEAVLWEALNGLAAPSHRRKALAFYRSMHTARRVSVVPFSPEFISAAIGHYEAGSDKAWGIVDCLSFVLMTQRGVTAALTTDHHFEQAGFSALLLRNPP